MIVDLSDTYTVLFVISLTEIAFRQFRLTLTVIRSYIELRAFCYFV